MFDDDHASPALNGALVQGIDGQNLLCSRLEAQGISLATPRGGMIVPRLVS
jgi:hypothetical protein